MLPSRQPRDEGWYIQISATSISRILLADHVLEAGRTCLSYCMARQGCKDMLKHKKYMRHEPRKLARHPIHLRKFGLFGVSEYLRNEDKSYIAISIPANP